MEIDFLDTQEVKVVLSGDVLDFSTFFVSRIKIETIDILKSYPE